MIEPSPDLPQVIEGETRIEVYWDGEDEWFRGTIGMVRSKKRCWFVIYDDGDQEWINPNVEEYRILSQENEAPEKEPPVQKKKKPKITNQEFFDDNFCFRDFGDPFDSEWVAKGMARKFKSKDYIHNSISEKVKRRRQSLEETETQDFMVLQQRTPTQESPRKRIKVKLKTKNSPPKSLSLHSSLDPEHEKMKKESAKPLTMAQIREILGEDPMLCNDAGNWVRRSVRQPSRSALNSPLVKLLIDKLKDNDSDMVVLKMKKYVNDPNAPQIVIDAALDALEENTSCQALYIQNFNEGMRDEQVLKLIRILQRPSCNIWCLNIGETYKVKTSTWKKFTDGLKYTKITHMYASEHTITPELKDQIRTTIRDNRKKHRMHIDPSNLDVIVQCTHNWWNPINAKSLRPHLKKRGLDYLLKDKEALGLMGTITGAELK